MASKVFLTRRRNSRATVHCLMGWVLMRNRMVTWLSPNSSTPSISRGSKMMSANSGSWRISSPISFKTAITSSTSSL